MKNLAQIILKKENLNQTVVLNGWVGKVKKMGSIIFLNIYDYSLNCQIVVEENNSFFSQVLSLPKESAIKVEGVLVERKNPNLKIIGGNLEIILVNLEIYSKSLTPPLLIQDKTDALEETRLKYRYLDLRRNINQKNLRFRSKLFLSIRNYMQKNDFVEIETPYLSKQTPEGAKDYIVPVGKAKAFALPQSPQIYKQLLMVGGFLKYFQIARNFRNENLRIDRQPEFSQLDIELSFADEKQIFELTENLLKHVLEENLNYKLKTPFTKISYNDSIKYYGLDKPDLRFDFKIFDCYEILNKSQSEIIEKAIENKAFFKSVLIDNWQADNKQLKFLEKIAKDNGAKGLISIVFNQQEIINGTGEKFLEKNIIKSFFKSDIKSGTLFIVLDKENICYKSLGAVRFESIKLSNLKPKEKFKFAWVIDWPLFEYDSENKKYSASHHPFTAPRKEHEKDFDINLKSAIARQYDIVLNGFELGGGSIRIIDKDIQSRMFKAVGLNSAQIEKKFGFLLKAFDYGVPPHAGIALGLDRLLMLLLETETIRDVIAFPKNSAGIDLMMNCPSNVDEELLKDLNLDFKKY